jgi:hypothetical protein
MKTLLLFLAFSAAAKATMIVYDPALHSQTVADQMVNFAKWAKTEADAAQTQLNTLQTYENTVLQVARLGNPAALRNIPVIGPIASLVGTGQQLYTGYQRIQALGNPQYMQGQLGSIVNRYSLYNWNPMVPGSYQFYTSSWQVSQSAQDQLLVLEKQRQNLEASRDQLLAQIQGATTQSDVQKYSAALNGVNGALAEVSARAHETALQSQLQSQQLYNAREIQRSQTIEMSGSSFAQDANRSINMLQNLSLGYGTLPRWNQ